MTNTLNNSIFQSIKNALAQENSASAASEILKTEVGNTYTVRLLPYVKDPKNTFFHFFSHGWTSFSTGAYVGSLSPQTFGERDPIAEERFRLYRTGTEDEKKKAAEIKRSEKWLVNVFVVNDPVNPENNGKVKILRYGKQLQKIIKDAIEGEESADYGPRVFDLSPNGVNLKIKVEKQGDYPSYVSSKFTMPAALPDMDDNKAKKLLDSTHDLTKVFPVKSYDELKKMLDEHFHCKNVSDAPATVVEKKVEKKETVPAKSDDEEIKDLLAGLDIDKE